MNLRFRPDRLAQALQAEALSQVELARRIGASRDTIARWLDGERHPNGAHLVALAEAVGRPERWFYELTDVA